ILLALGSAPLGRELHSALPLLDLVAQPLDPVRLPDQLAATARRHGGPVKVVLIVPRKDANHHVTDHALPPMKWQPEWDNDHEMPFGWSSPLAIPQLGLAYSVTSRVVDV